MIKNVSSAEINEASSEVLAERLLEDTRALIISCLKDSSLRSLIDDHVSIFAGGKMLRARLAVKIGLANGVDKDLLLRAAASVEMMHAASLLHDDVIDGGTLRRGEPSFWVKESVSGAILLGDLLVCKASGLLTGAADDCLVQPFIRFSSEMCDAEAEQELILRGQDMGWSQAVSVARRKTGSLFAFSAHTAAGCDEAKQTALTESGYELGTAYQLADDILDAFGDDESSDKTLGQDAGRTKQTAAVTWKGEDVDPLIYIDDLCKASAERLSSWPELQLAWNDFFASDIEPVISRFVDRFPAKAVG